VTVLTHYGLRPHMLEALAELLIGTVGSWNDELEYPSNFAL